MEVTSTERGRQLVRDQAESRGRVSDAVDLLEVFDVVPPLIVEPMLEVETCEGES